MADGTGLDFWTRPDITMPDYLSKLGPAYRRQDVFAPEWSTGEPIMSKTGVEPVMPHTWDLRNPFGTSTLPTDPTAGFGSKAAGAPGMTALNWAPMMAALAKAISPYRTDYKGNKIPGFGEKLGESITQMSQAQLMAKALAAGGGSGGINPFLLMSMFSQGGLYGNR